MLCTGSQGEPLAALSRIANGTHKQIKLRPDDIVIFSSSAIPGNALSIARTINRLYLQGVKVYTTSVLSDLHTSGHANEEELKLMIRLIMPKYFVPGHGEYRMLKQHANIAISCDIPQDHTFVLKNGDVLTLKNHVVTKAAEGVVAEDIYVDGNRIGEIGSSVIKDRKIMSNDGILVVIANIDQDKRQLLIKPNITTRGFVLVNENEALIHKIEELAANTIRNKLSTGANFNEIKAALISDLVPAISDLTGRKPLILPVILPIKKPIANAQ